MPEGKKPARRRVHSQESTRHMKDCGKASTDFAVFTCTPRLVRRATGSRACCAARCRDAAHNSQSSMYLASWRPRERRERSTGARS